MTDRLYTSDFQEVIDDTLWYNDACVGTFRDSFESDEEYEDAVYEYVQDGVSNFLSELADKAENIIVEYVNDAYSEWEDGMEYLDDDEFPDLPPRYEDVLYSAVGAVVSMMLGDYNHHAYISSDASKLERELTPHLKDFVAYEIAGRLSE